MHAIVQKKNVFIQELCRGQRMAVTVVNVSVNRQDPADICTRRESAVYTALSTLRIASLIIDRTSQTEAHVGFLLQQVGHRPQLV